MHPARALSSCYAANYIYGSHAVLLAYDITNDDSFHNLEDWLAVVTAVFEKDDVKPYLGALCMSWGWAEHELGAGLVGNKMDLNHLRAVGTSKHKVQGYDIYNGYTCQA